MVQGGFIKEQTRVNIRFLFLSNMDIILRLVNPYPLGRYELHSKITLCTNVLCKISGTWRDLSHEENYKMERKEGISLWNVTKKKSKLSREYVVELKAPLIYL